MNQADLPAEPYLVFDSRLAGMLELQKAELQVDAENELVVLPSPPPGSPHLSFSFLG